MDLIIADVEKDDRVKSLVDDLKNKMAIVYKPSALDNWSVLLDENVAYIYYKDCKDPAAALAHELLHIETQLKGFKRLRYGFSGHFDPMDFKPVIDCFDNELQHHKFYDRFISLGFTPESFYDDSDISTESYLHNIIKNNSLSLIQMIPSYFTLLAPGGSISEKGKADLLNCFYGLNNGIYKNQMIKIKNTCDKWRISQSYDIVPVVRELMLEIQPKPNFSWFGFKPTDRPPNQGFFVDEEFEFEESHN